ncbi:MAG: hypothetical protein IPL23_21715 [Saprospiraceae bacterium]|nr:hypothetical protein [Saprospiraceae bacterium]
MHWDKCPFNDTDAKEYYLLSVHGRANLNVGERLLITGTLRSDGTSRFSPRFQMGSFSQVPQLVINLRWQWRRQTFQFESKI